MRPMRRLATMRLCVLATAIVALVAAEEPLPSSRPLPGGVRPADITEEMRSKVFDLTVKHYHETSNSAYHFLPTNLLSAKRQVVAGQILYVDVLFQETGCFKNAVDDDELLSSESCQLKESGSRQLCAYKIYERPWDKEFETEVTLERPCSTFNGILDTRKWRAFEMWRETHNVQYANKSEHLHRFQIFKDNLQRIKELQRKERGTARYGVNRFADMTPEEFRSTRLSPEWPLDLDYPSRQAEIPDANGLPTSFDWREHGAVTPVKNQGSCGSCWAFSTTGNIEGAWKIKKGHLVSLSEQELVDCDKLDEGCSGGLPSNAYREIMRLGGLEGERDYPYEGRNDQCQLKKTSINVFINDSVKLSQNETEMAAWLVKNGPISIGLNANAMMWYWGGISHPWRIACNPSSLDHGVLIVGFGEEKGQKYWIIKNSWGTWWGERGYYRLHRGDGTCGVNRMATSAVVD